MQPPIPATAADITTELDRQGATLARVIEHLQRLDRRTIALALAIAAPDALRVLLGA